MKAERERDPKRSNDRSSMGAREFGGLIGLGLWIGAALAALVLRLLGYSYRMRVVAGEDILNRLLDEPRPVLLTFWHNQLFGIGCFMFSFLFPRGFPVTLLASYSRDGELVARVGRLFGFEAIRGSASRGGRHAMRKLYRTLTRDRSSPVTIPDGPRGPIYKCKPGVIVLAQLSGSPLLPLACRAEKAWRLSSWDRLFVPKPFSRVSIAVGEPISVPGELSEEELKQAVHRVEETLNELSESARRGRGNRRVDLRPEEP